MSGSSSEGEGKVESVGKMKRRHKLELKELKTKYDKLLHGIPKSDKAKRKELDAQVKKDEAALLEKHKRELADAERAAEEMERLRLEEEQRQREEEKLAMGPTRHEKRKEKREEETKQEEEERLRIAREMASRPSAAKMEKERLTEALQQLQLSIEEIAPDGDCLYNAFAAQLRHAGLPAVAETPAGASKALRRRVGEYLLAHQAEFQPFVFHDDAPVDDAGYRRYVETLMTTNVWGGHTELQVLASLFQRPIQVFMAGEPTLTVGEQFAGAPLRLSYHKHMYALGEHYNSVIAAMAAPDSA